MNAPQSSAWLSSLRRSALARALPEILIAIIAAIMIMFETWVFDPGGWMAGRTAAGLIAALSLAFVRRAPFPAYLANALAIYALISLGFPSQYYQWTNLIALISLASRARPVVAVVSLVLGYGGIIYYFAHFPQEGDVVLAGAVLAVWTAGWFAGRAQFARGQKAQAKVEMDVASADLRAQRARTELEVERATIARELHDVVGHAVNVMVVHAGAGQGLTDAGSKEAEIFTTIATTGRSALADLDRMLDVLQGNASRTPLPGLAELDELCGAVRSTGLDVQLSVDDPEPVSPGVGLTTYRIVQEALTNVVKHAHASTVQVEVSVRAGSDVAITVRDNGTGGQPIPGRGLGGISARAVLHGGSVRYGPARDGGFEVAALLPAGSA